MYVAAWGLVREGERTVPIEEVVKNANRYLFLRTCSPVQFVSVWRRCLDGHVHFDACVDEEMKRAIDQKLRDF